MTLALPLHIPVFNLADLLQFFKTFIRQILVCSHLFVIFEIFSVTYVHVAHLVLSDTSYTDHVSHWSSCQWEMTDVRFHWPVLCLCEWEPSSWNDEKQ